MFKKLFIFSIILLGISLNLFASVYNFSSADDSLKIEITLFDLRIQYPSTGVQFYRDGIIYLLDSKLTRESKGEYVPFGSLSMYYSPLKDDKLEKQIYFLKKDPFPYPADAVSFTDDYSKIFFTHESRFRGYRDNAIRIYEATIRLLKNGKSDFAIKPSELPFNSKMYSCVQPAISADGKFLIFSSDMPGGQGGLDLYYSIFKDGSWEDPINLGKDINSELDESFPFIDKDGNLFFSSNGHEGYGKYDIYFARLIKAYRWDKPINLGQPLNSEKDDVAFVLSRVDETQGFFATDRNVSGKQYQIFKVKMYGNIRLLSQDKPIESETTTQALEEGTKDVPEATVITSKTTDKTNDKTEAEETEKPNPEILFRVQFKASPKSLGSFNVLVNDQQYKTYEYFYKGAYRYTIGEFETLEEALKLNQDCKKKDYPDAFVVAFRGSERVIDPQVFKR
jgi:hypothetical protein